MSKGIDRDQAQVGLARRGLSETIADGGTSSALPGGLCKITPLADVRVVQHPSTETPTAGATDEFFATGVVQFIMIEKEGNQLTVAGGDVEITPYQN